MWLLSRFPTPARANLPEPPQPTLQTAPSIGAHWPSIGAYHLAILNWARRCLVACTAIEIGSCHGVQFDRLSPPFSLFPIASIPHVCENNRFAKQIFTRNRGSPVPLAFCANVPDASRPRAAMHLPPGVSIPLSPSHTSRTQTASPRVPPDCVA
ncbi:hypothetical protein EJ06DRAFT_313361 [Trichodelitschia bisporula]|uniref:Uncharacterized protein n=1 Tax=Trichodelitschia bisporula TaxID=703511 RepID=A0A6G1I3P1_9PEZI|nr:hypothetical protein EJ06DRAFT_313361 [Trichodelitschia bisporula]